MRNKMNQHSEETNELFNLMARQIKKRCEERINLCAVVDKEQKNPNILMDEQEMDDLMLSDEKDANGILNATASNQFIRPIEDGASTSRGNSPPKDFNDQQ